MTGRLAARLAVLVILAALAAPAPSAGQAPVPAGARPRPTEHPPLPSSPAEYWLVPPRGWSGGRANAVSAARALAQAARLIDEERYAQALTYIRPSPLAATPLAGYAAYMTGLAQLELERFDEAIRIARA